MSTWFIFEVGEKSDGDGWAALLTDVEPEQILTGDFPHDSAGSILGSTHLVAPLWHMPSGCSPRAIELETQTSV